ncbi:MAG: glycosyltransferase family 2 protein, partial [Paracoccaceae bacterium]
MTGDASSQKALVGAVVIGRNEGQRLIDCLTSMRGQVARIVYVDSGSTDGSQDAATALGAEVVGLDTSVPFTAARARNAGLDHLAAQGRVPGLVQFVDGDCVLDPEWITRAGAFLQDHPEVAVVCGRRRERFPEATVFNRLIDAEWDTPIGEAKACGGDALMRFDALRDAGGYDPGLIAGEEPELCVRLRAAGWKVWRLEAEMTLHDAAISRVGQWWSR